MLKTEAIDRFLKLKTESDLAALYNQNMEVQVNVARDGGTRVDGEFKGREWHAYTDGLQTWKAFRIPWNARTEPHYEDSEIQYDLSEHAEGIGMTGWDYEERVSRWVAFDFDAIMGHSDQHAKKLSFKDLKEIQDVVRTVEWITLRSSTGGKGLHLYVFLDPVIPTQNHTEHAALARSIIGMLSALTGHDFKSKVDVCGGNMWVWHRRKAEDGLKLIKTGKKLFEIPENWKEHIEVIKGTRKRTIPKFVQGIPEIESIFEQLTSQRSKVPFEKEHIRVLEHLNSINALWWFDKDRHMVVCHTADLKKVHDDLGLRGIFETLATGTEVGGDQNAFMFSLRNGGWAVRRHTPGCAEHAIWVQDGEGWTKCFYNVLPDLNMVATANQGIEHKAGGFVFAAGDHAELALNTMGMTIKLPPAIRSRETKVKQHKDGRIIVEVTATSQDPPLAGWLKDRNTWHKVFNFKTPPSLSEHEAGCYDDLIRHIVTEAGDDYGWSIKSEGIWRNEPLTHVKAGLESLDFKVNEVKSIIGSSVFKCWTLVNKPFEDEYPGDRQWNRDAAQLRFVPAKKENLTYPTWLKVLKHCGNSLNDVLRTHPWATGNSVLSGTDYLKCWLASLFQCPTEPLPYLFLYGEQNTGKSILHESISLLLTTGCTRADHALVSPSGFNGELENAVLCVVEETDLRQSHVAYNRIKDWVTSRYLPIHRKQKTPYHIINTSHWIQTNNDHKACPIFPGDTRITTLHVRSLDPLELIPKRQLIVMLEKEAPDFLAEILTLEIPPSNDRLNVPVIETPDKINITESSKDALDLFCSEQLYNRDGHSIKFSDFYEKFLAWVDPDETVRWSRIRTARDLPPQYLKGRLKENNQLHIGNVSWEEGSGKGKYVLMDGKLGLR